MRFSKGNKFPSIFFCHNFLLICRLQINTRRGSWWCNSSPGPSMSIAAPAASASPSSIVDSTSTRKRTPASSWPGSCLEVRNSPNVVTSVVSQSVILSGQAARFGVRENDKIMTINSKTPRNVDDAVAVIKSAGNQIKLVVLREEDVVPDIQVEGERLSTGGGDPADASWASETIDIVSKLGWLGVAGPCLSRSIFF